jgi:integrase
MSLLSRAARSFGRLKLWTIGSRPPASLTVLCFGLLRRAGESSPSSADAAVGRAHRQALGQAAKLDPDQFAGHSLRAGFVTSALEAGADLLKVMDVTRHREVKTLQAYDRRAKAFKNHAGGKFL